MALMRHSDRRLTDKIYTDENLLGTSSAIEAFPSYANPASQGASQEFGRSRSKRVIGCHHGRRGGNEENHCKHWRKSRFGTTCHNVVRTRGMAGVAGLEPVTSAVTGQRSNQLSYTPAHTGANLRKPTGRVKAKKRVRAADAKEVGVGNPAEETCCYPNQLNLPSPARLSICPPWLNFGRDSHFLAILGRTPADRRGKAGGNSFCSCFRVSDVGYRLVVNAMK